MIQEIQKETRENMESSLARFQKELARIRTGRASVSLLDTIRVDYYDTMTPLTQLANITTPDSQTIAVQPWDISAIQAIEKSIMGSDLGLTPMNDGKLIRIPIPPLTEERRRELAKVVKRESENCKVSIRNVRRESMDTLKSLEKDKLISQDEQKKGQEEVQKTTDSFVKRSEEMSDKKEREIMEE